MCAWGVEAAHVSDRGHGVGAAKGNTPDERAKAVRAVARLSRDAEDCAQLLDVLGLSASEARP